MTSCGPDDPASSLSKRIVALEVAGVFRTSVRAIAPDAFCCAQNAVRSSSYRLPAVPTTVPLASTLTAIAGRLFHVSEDSSHETSLELKTWNGTLGEVVLSNLPNSRSLADVMAG